MAVLTTLIIFILLILTVIWGHFFIVNRQQQSQESDVRDNTNVELYHEHKAEIEADFTSGKIDEENYEYLKTELDKSLLQDMQSSTVNSDASKHLSLIWPVIISVFVLVSSGVFYAKNGAFEQLSQPKANPHAGQSSQDMQILQAIEQIQSVLQQQPDNGDMWYQLGQGYVSAGMFDKALEAFDEVQRVEGEKADVYGAKAQAQYYLDQQQLTPQVQSYVDKALAIDANDSSTNIMLGMHYFTTQAYEEAIKHWQRVLSSGKQNVNANALQEAINEAKSRLGMAVEKSEAAGDGPSLSVSVSVSDEFAAELIANPNKTVFIYAVPSEGPRMPVAAVKISAKDLPSTIVLDNSRAMSPQMNLSTVQSVNIFAVLSQSGTPGIKPGDYKGELNAVAVSTTETLSLTINTLVE